MRRLNIYPDSERSICPVRIGEMLHDARRVRTPFSDGDILELQDLFLRNGVHYIKVDDVRAGRSFIKLFLQSMNYYNNVACLSTSTEPIDSAVVDLYAELLVGGCFDKGATQHLEEFFLEHFDFDFLWLEVSDGALTSEWLSEVLRQMKNFKLEQLLPILIVSYDAK